MMCVRSGARAASAPPCWCSSSEAFLSTSLRYRLSTSSFSHSNPRRVDRSYLETGCDSYSTSVGCFGYGGSHVAATLASCAGVSARRRVRRVPHGAALDACSSDRRCCSAPSCARAAAVRLVSSGSSSRRSSTRARAAPSNSRMAPMRMLSFTSTSATSSSSSPPADHHTSRASAACASSARTLCCADASRATSKLCPRLSRASFVWLSSPISLRRSLRSRAPSAAAARAPSSSSRTARACACARTLDSSSIVSALRDSTAALHSSRAPVVRR
mmetsp:Transcript_23990/g.61844  ORF Transcript_23990/g.61844 Transcript_23990/m.61844 type:complete len:273 (-) Transcript_23990:372-1190(-)